MFSFLYFVKTVLGIYLVLSRESYVKIDQKKNKQKDNFALSVFVGNFFC